MKYGILVSALLAAGALAAGAALADDGSWLVRGRIVDLQFKEGSVGSQVLYAEDKAFPEVDVTYFFTPSIAAELILTYPQAHTISLGGAAIGSLKELPPTLTLQYHFNPSGEIRPYAGVGVNYTRFSDVNLAGGAVTVGNDSTGLAGQLGLDYKLTPNWFLNADAKYIAIHTHVYSGGAQLTDFKLDPWALSLGLGYRF